MPPVIETAIKYVGPAKGHKQDPHIELEGDAKTIFSENGRRIFEMNVNKEECDGPLAISNGDYGKFGSFQVEDAKGIFKVVDAVVQLKSQSFGSDPKMVVRFLAMDGTYETFAGESLKPKYWRVSLIDCVTDYMEYKSEYDSHPLSTPKQWKIYFTFRGREIFIEPIPEYGECVKILREENKSLITAVMVGEILDGDDLDAYKDWLPMDAVSYLGVATGNRVSISWIEIFDETGVLIRRLHPAYIAKDYAGHPLVINEAFHRGIGELLTKGLVLQGADAQAMRVRLNQLIASSDSYFIEEELSVLAQALDKESNGRKLVDDLSRDTKAKFTALVDVFVNDVDTLAQTDIEDGDKEIIGIFKNKAEGLLHSDEGFSKRLIRLMRENKLYDFEILKDCNFRHKKRKWEKIVNYYRNVVAHEGTIRFGEDEDIEFVFKVVKHLEDVLLRLIFKKVGYTGKYQPRTVMGVATDATADWVTMTTQPKAFGYERWLEETATLDLTCKLPSKPISENKE
jgi:hypothetical protein